MNLSEIQKRLDAQNRILNAWLALLTELQDKDIDVLDKSELTIEVVRGNINRVCINITTLEIEQLKLERGHGRINRANLI